MQARPQPGSSYQLHPPSCSSDSPSLLPAALSPAHSPGCFCRACKQARGCCELQEQWHPLQRHRQAALTCSAGTKPDKAGIYLRVLTLLGQEKIISNISASIRVRHLSEAQPLGLCLGCLLPALRPAAESAETAQVARGLVIYQC